LVQIEAASQGTPSVFIEGAATAATVTNNVNGFIAKPTPAAYAAKIEEILNDENFYAKVSEGAKRDLYVTWDETVANLKEIYKNMIQKVL
jgi:glycosyltransferase involved in cell wall biosynthesis